VGLDRVTASGRAHWSCCRAVRLAACSLRAARTAMALHRAAGRGPPRPLQLWRQGPHLGVRGAHLEADVAGVAPLAAPAVLHDPVVGVGGGVSAVPHHQHTVVQRRAAAAAGRSPHGGGVTSGRGRASETNACMTRPSGAAAARSGPASRTLPGDPWRVAVCWRVCVCRGRALRRPNSRLIVVHASAVQLEGLGVRLDGHGHGLVRRGLL
jgi:hypothetical protein